MVYVLDKWYETLWLQDCKDGLRQFSSTRLSTILSESEEWNNQQQWRFFPRHFHSCACTTTKILGDLDDIVGRRLLTKWGSRPKAHIEHHDTGKRTIKLREVWDHQKNCIIYIRFSCSVELKLLLPCVFPACNAEVFPFNMWEAIFCEMRSGSYYRFSLSHWFLTTIGCHFSELVELPPTLKPYVQCCLFFKVFQVFFGFLKISSSWKNGIQLQEI